MSDFIDLAKPLQLTTPGTAPIAGLTVADTAALEAIESPWPGMFVYVQADGKTYRVTELKEVTVGVFTKMAVKSYEPVPDNAALENKFNIDQLGAPGGAASLDESGKVPSSQLPSTAGTRPATLSLPIPADLDGENITLVIDFSADGEFSEEPVNYTRVKMADSYGKMRVFCNNSWEAVPGPSLGIPYYCGTVEFTLDQELFPGYVAGNKYYARYCWVDSRGNSGDWTGFAFTGDVSDMVPIRTNEPVSLNVAEERLVSGSIALDYLNAEVHNLTLKGDATLSLENISNVSFGNAMIVNVSTGGYTLTVVGVKGNYTCSEDKTYVICVTNFGILNIAVTETV